MVRRFFFLMVQQCTVEHVIVLRSTKRLKIEQVAWHDISRYRTDSYLLRFRRLEDPVKVIGQKWGLSP